MASRFYSKAHSRTFLVAELRRDSIVIERFTKTILERIFEGRIRLATS